MAGISWIKVETTLPNKPVVLSLRRLLKKSQNEVVGMLVRLLCWADGVTDDGVLHGLTEEDVDIVVDCKGFGAALVQVGWLVNSDELQFSAWERHNGQGAKRRAMNARCNAEYKQKVSKLRDEGEQEVSKNGLLDKIRINKSANALSAGARACEDVGGLAALCRAYPKRTFANATVKAAYDACLADGITAEELIACLGMAKLSKAWQEEGGRFIPKLVVWLNERRFESDLGVIRQDAARKRSERQAQSDEDEMNELVYGFEEDEL